MEEEIRYYSGPGYSLSAVISIPDIRDASEPCPGIILCQGYAGLKEALMPSVAARLTAEGYVTLRFDYRGFGESDGPRHRLIPLEQIEDIRNGLSRVGHWRAHLYWATFPAALPKIPYVGFSPVRLQASGTSQFGTEPSAGSPRSRPIPPYPRTDAAFAPPFDDATRRLMRRLCVRNRRLQHRHLSPEALAPAGLCCPGHHRLSASSASLDVSASFPGTTGYRRGL